MLSLLKEVPIIEQLIGILYREMRDWVLTNEAAFLTQKASRRGT